MKPSERIEELSTIVLEQFRAETASENFEAHKGHYITLAIVQAVITYLDEVAEQKREDAP